jgi:hypothetical protein
MTVGGIPEATKLKEAYQNSTWVELDGDHLDGGSYLLENFPERSLI